MELPIEEAKKLGAMALFGEKYGKIVRVVKAGDFSTEFCGGTHVANSGNLGFFKIISEASVAAGIRRITAFTGVNAANYIRNNEAVLSSVAASLKTNSSDVGQKVEALINTSRNAEKEIKKLNAEITKLESKDRLSQAEKIGDIDLYKASYEGVDVDALRSMGDELKNKSENCVAVLSSVNGEKANFVAVCSKGAISKGVKAGDLVREVAKLAGGGGGGRPDSAAAGAKNVSAVPDAMEKVSEIVKSLIK